MSGKPFAGVTLARLVKPWGIRGEIAAQVFSDFPEHLTGLQEVWLSDGTNPPRLARIQSCRMHLGRALFHFSGVDTVNDAERFRGLEVQVPLSERPQLDADRHYVTDLIGCAVWETGAIESLGTVEDVLNGGATAGPRAPESWLLSVATPQGELLIPMAAEICTSIDTAARRIEVRLPEGLREVNERPRKQVPDNDTKIRRAGRGRNRHHGESDASRNDASHNNASRNDDSHDNDGHDHDGHNNDAPKLV